MQRTCTCTHLTSSPLHPTVVIFIMCCVRFQPLALNYALLIIYVLGAITAYGAVIFGIITADSNV